MRYYIEEGFIGDIEKKLNRIANKCKRNGNSFTYKRVGEEMREEKPNFKHSYPIAHRFIIVEVEGCAQVNGYEIVAVLDMHEGGNVIRTVGSSVEIPERFRNSANVCEHCHSSRTRNSLYVVYNHETGDYKQVGRNCLAEYIGGLDAENAVARLDGIMELEAYNGRFSGGEKSVQYFPIRSVLGYAVEFINKMGYFNANGRVTTRNLVACMFQYKAMMSDKLRNVNRMLDDANFDVRFDGSDFGLAETEQRVDEIINYYANLNDNSVFAHNIKVLVQQGYVSGRDFGFVCYMPEGYNKYRGREIQRAKETKDSQYFGDIGVRYKNEQVAKVEKIAAYDSEYGAIYWYKITLKSGEVLIWRTSTFLYEIQMNGFNSATFTVKAHNEYRGVKQTEITRAKLA